MSKVLIAGLVAVGFIIMTIILFVAKRRWRGLDIPAIISAIGTIVAIIVTILAIPDSSSQPAAVAEPPTSTATPTPAITPGYTLYDDFEAENAMEANWRWNDEEGLCGQEVRAGKLVFECRNDSTQDKGAALHPSHATGETVGVAAMVSVQKAGGPLQLVTKWQNQGDGSEWQYHLEAEPGVVRAVKYDLKTGYDHQIVLGEAAVDPGVAHELRIERTDRGMLFFVDGEEVAVETAANLSPRFKMVYWAFAFWVWQDGNAIAGQIDVVSAKEEGK
ncbi:MAG: hypothetical protein JXM73_26080 [Anaerolineae bacterium]|nr:hypothetical protein [Anaerolineae bacterium]